MRLAELQGKDCTFDVRLEPVTGAPLRLELCLPPPPSDKEKKLLRLNLESNGAYPEEGAAPSKLVHVTSPARCGLRRRRDEEQLRGRLRAVDESETRREEAAAGMRRDGGKIGGEQKLFLFRSHGHLLGIAHL